MVIKKCFRGNKRVHLPQCRGEMLPHRRGLGKKVVCWEKEGTTARQTWPLVPSSYASGSLFSHLSKGDKRFSLVGF